MTTPPAWMRQLDELLIAPNATGAERLAGYGSAFFGAAFACVLAVTSGLNVWISLVLMIVGFDVFGGVVVNATVSGRS